MTTKEQIEEKVRRILWDLSIEMIEAGREYPHLTAEKVANQTWAMPSLATNAILELVNEAKREVFNLALGEMREVHKENFMYRTLYGEIKIPSDKTTPHELLKEYQELEPEREQFANYVEKRIDQLQAKGKE